MASNFLFLGYGLKDWNMNVIFKQLWTEQKIATKSWSIQYKPDPVEQIRWDKHNVEIIDLSEYGMDQSEYVAKLKDRIESS